MKRFSSCVVIMVALFMVCTGFVTNAWAEDAVQVIEGTMCTDVADRNCINSNTRFVAPIDKLFCFTKITGAQNDTSVTHVWYYGDTERARVGLDVRSSSWRTYSSKIIQPHEIGDWHVDVLGEGGQLLMVIPFEVHM